MHDAMQLHQGDDYEQLLGQFNALLEFTEDNFRKHMRADVSTLATVAVAAVGGATMAYANGSTYPWGTAMNAAVSVAAFATGYMVDDPDLVEASCVMARGFGCAVAYIVTYNMARAAS